MKKSYDSEFRNGKLLPLLLKFAFPSTMVALSSILFSITDRYFIGQAIGRPGIAAVTIAFPLVALIDATGMFFNVGGSSLVGVLMGQGNLTGARKTLGTSMFAVLVLGILYTFLSLVFLEPLSRFLGATDANIIYVKEYIFYLLPSAVFQIAFWSFCSFVRSEGKPMKSMNINFVSIITNVVLDYYFIVVLGWGMKGAAIATSFANFMPAALLFIHFYKSEIIKLEFQYIKWDLKIFKGMFPSGFSSFFNDFLYATYTFILNIQLLKYGGEIALISLGIMTILRNFINTSYIGVSVGRQPIISFNWGAKNFKRIKEVFLLSFWITIFNSIVLIGILLIFSEEIISFFIKDDPEVVSYTTNAINYHLKYMTGTAIYLICATYFQAIRKGQVTTRFVFLRLLVLSIPLSYILPLKWGVIGVYLSFPIADCITALVALFFMKKELKLLDIKAEKHRLLTHSNTLT